MIGAAAAEAGDLRLWSYRPPASTLGTMEGSNGDERPASQRWWPLRRGRPDGRLAAGVPGYRRFMPALMPGRNESIVYFDQRLRVDAAERLVAAIRADAP